MCIIDLNSVNTFLPLIFFVKLICFGRVFWIWILYVHPFFPSMCYPFSFFIYIFYFTPRSFATPPFLSFLLFSIEICDAKIFRVYFFLLMPFPTLLLLFTLSFSDYESFRVCKIPDVLLLFYFCFFFCLTVIVKFLKFTFYLLSCHNLIS